MRVAKIFTVFYVAILTVSAISKSQAGMPIFFITHDGQDALVLGTVVAVTQDAIQFHPELTLSGYPLHSTIMIRDANVVTEPANLQPRLAQGDYALVSLDQEDHQYKLAFGSSKVSSLNPETLKILDSNFRFDHRLMLQWYVNSCTQGKDFLGNGSTVSVKQSQDSWLPIAQKHRNTWVPLQKASFYHGACNRLLLNHRIAATLPWLGGATFVMGAMFFVFPFVMKSLSRRYKTQ